jgi:hypothetical protein
MPFLAFEPILAAVAILFLVVIGFTVRGLRRKRQAAAGQPNAEPERQPESRPSEAPLPGLKKNAPEPDPEPAEGSVPRRRQLHSFAEAAAVEADEGETLTVLPEAPAAEAWPADTALAETPDAPAQDESADFEQAVLARLEEAFDALESGALTLDAYVARVEATEAEVEQRIAERSDDTDPTELDAALAARESVRWCLNWAKERDQPQ